MKPLRWVAAAGLGLAGLALGLDAALARAYRTPQGPHERTPDDLGLDYETWNFPGPGDLTLHGWWIPHAGRPAPARGTLVLLHGWGRDAARMLDLVPPLYEAGYDLLLLDARCHGLSGCRGVASMLTFSQDLRAAVSRLIAHGADPSSLAILAHSAGGAGAIHATAHDPRIRALVTIGAFANPEDMTRLDLARRGLPRFLVPAVLSRVQRRIGARFADIAPENVAPRIDVPFLIVHGGRDAIVPVAHARRIAAACPDARRLILPGRGHSDCDQAPEFWPAVLSHLDAALAH